MTGKMRVILATAAGIAITAAAALPFPLVEYTLWPGETVASLFWPEGIHSDFSGSYGVVAMLAVIWCTAIAAWSLLVYLVAHVFGRARAA